MKGQGKEKLTAGQMALIGLMTAVICVLGPLAIPIPFSPVPISFAAFAIYLTAYVLGARLAAVSCLLYLCLGGVGLPVLSGFSGGLGKLAGPTGGYLLAYPVLAFCSGFAIDAYPVRRSVQGLGMLVGLFVCYGVGTLWLSLQLHIRLSAAFAVGVLPYLIGDACKIAAALYLGPKLRKGLRRVAG